MNSARDQGESGEAPLLPPATVAELTVTERQQQLDPMYPLRQFKAKGLNECFLGRTTELLELSQIFQGVEAKRPHPKDRAYGALLFGSPGSGKSALKDYWREKCRTENHAILEVPAEAFSSQRGLKDALMLTDEWETATWLNRTIETAGITITELGEAGAHGLTEAIRATTGEEIPAEFVPILGGLLKLSRSQPQTWKDCIKALSAAFEGGWTIAVDEAEDLDRYVDNEDTRMLLKTIADPSLRPGKDGKGGLLLAGLSDTVRTIDEFRLTRLHKIRMGALSPGTAMGIINAAVEDSEMSESLKDLLRVRWIRTLSRDFHHWPHHTRCAAVALRHASELLNAEAKRRGAKRDHDFDHILEQVRTWSANGATQLYRDRYRNTQDLSDEDLPREVVALAEACGGPMHETQLLALIENRMREMEHAGVKVEHAPRQWLKALNHGGLIEPIIPRPIDEGLEETAISSKHYRVAIPSMASHIERHSEFDVDPGVVKKAKETVLRGNERKVRELIRQAAAEEQREKITAEEWETIPVPDRSRPVNLLPGWGEDEDNGNTD